MNLQTLVNVSILNYGYFIFVLLIQYNETIYFLAGIYYIFPMNVFKQNVIINVYNMFWVYLNKVRINCDLTK